MGIKNELLSFLNLNIKEKGTKTRNIEIIAYYYGFRGSSWPTLDETAREFNIGTRERIRQIIDDNFRNIVDLVYIPSIVKIGEVVESNPFWIQAELENKLIELEVIKNIFSIRGLFNLIEDVGIDNRYKIYSPDLKEATRSSIARYEQNFIIKNSEIKKIKSIYKKAQNIPGMSGISNLKHLEDEITDFSIYSTIIRDLIKYSENAWIKAYGDNFWYLFENKHNTLINYSEKIFTVIDNCDVKRLAETYRNALNRRTYKFPYPPVEIITEYLRSSIYFENNQDTLTFIGETTPLNEIEKDVVEYLKAKGSVKYPEFRDHLITKGHGNAHTDKVIMSSPFVHVDKSKGRLNYEYTLVSKIKETVSQNAMLNDRYRQFVLKLRNISDRGTDEPVEQKRRREQKILQQWLFDGKDQERCAICGNKYSVDALVTAHKKKRANCNEAERLDPYIVMPVCVFGCDYLYENKHIYIEDGVIKAGLPIKYDGQEQKIIKMLVGRKIDKEWQKGRKTYFEPV